MVQHHVLVLPRGVWWDLVFSRWSTPDSLCDGQRVRGCALTAAQVASPHSDETQGDPLPLPVWVLDPWVLNFVQHTLAPIRPSGAPTLSRHTLCHSGMGSGRDDRGHTCMQHRAMCLTRDDGGRRSERRRRPNADSPHAGPWAHRLTHDSARIW